MNQSIQEFFDHLESHPDSVLFGEMHYGVVSSNGFGLDPNDILTGKAKTTEDGTRVNLGLYGKITGKLEGAFNGRDFLHFLTSGNATSNIHGVITTEDQQRIAVKVLGETSGDGELIYHIILRHNSDAYSWVNAKHLFGKGKTDPLSHKTTVTLYAFDENPLDVPLAFADPDKNTVDYANFPFKLEQLQNDSAATIIYAGSGHLNTVESFGADVNAVFSGNFRIPDEGLRMNGYFTGPVAGSINGVISGVNYLRVMPDGSMRMNSKIMATTYEGESLLLEAQGASFPQTGTAWFETSLAVSNLEKYARLTRLYNVGVGSTDVVSQEINYNHYGYLENPFSN